MASAVAPKIEREIVLEERESIAELGEINSALDLLAKAVGELQLVAQRAEEGNLNMGYDLGILQSAFRYLKFADQHIEAAARWDVKVAGIAQIIEMQLAGDKKRLTEEKRIFIFAKNFEQLLKNVLSLTQEATTSCAKAIGGIRGTSRKKITYGLIKNAAKGALKDASEAQTYVMNIHNQLTRLLTLEKEVAK